MNTIHTEFCTVRASISVAEVEDARGLATALQSDEGRVQ
jgi:hypothetical protein